MKKIIVIGGGFAGLTASVLLSERGFKVELYESSPKLGGRAYSFHHSPTGDLIDNGQHIMMGCYHYTLKFLRKIEAEKNIELLSPLHVSYIERGGRQFELKARHNIYPLNLFGAIMRFGGLPVRKRFKLFLPFISLLYPFKHEKMTVEEWILKLNQDDEIVERFWKLLAISTLNAPLDQISAEQFKTILRIMFLTGNKSSAIVLPKHDLSNMYVYYARHFIEKHGGKVFLSRRITGLDFENDKISAIHFEGKTVKDFDFVITAIPPYALQKILPEKYLPLPPGEIKYSPILTLHLWLKNNPFTEKYYGLIDSKIHWIFNHGKHISLVASAAEELAPLKEEELVDLFLDELKNYFPLFYRELVTDKKLIIEKRATFIVTPEIHKKRQEIINKKSDIIFAGDWVNTGLPSTIESAVKSGYKGAQTIIDFLKHNH